jgi:hypothetical protein
MLIRRKALVQIRISSLERARWAAVAATEGVRMSELVREAVRQRVIDLERLRLLGREPSGGATPA